MESSVVDPKDFQSLRAHNVEHESSDTSFQCNDPKWTFVLVDLDLV